MTHSLFSFVTQANPAEPVAQVRFVDLRLFSRRTPNPVLRTFFVRRFTLSLEGFAQGGICFFSMHDSVAAFLFRAFNDHYNLNPPAVPHPCALCKGEFSSGFHSKRNADS